MTPNRLIARRPAHGPARRPSRLVAPLRSAQIGALLLGAAFLLSATSLATAPLAAEAAKPTESVRLSLERYQALMLKAGGQASDAAWSRARVEVTLPSPTQPFARVVITGEVKVTGKRRAEVLLLPGDQIIESVTADGDSVPLLRRAGAHLLVIEDPSASVSIRMVIQVRVRETAAGTSALIALPPVPGASVSVSGPGAASVQLWPSAKSSGNHTFEVPATTAVVLAWGLGAESGAVRSARYVVKPDAQGDGVDVSATFTVRVRQAPVQLRLIDETSALTSVLDGKQALVSTVADGWHRVAVRGAGDHVITATFRLAVDRSHGQPQIKLPLSKVPITRVEAQVVGERAVRFEPTVPLKTTVVGKGERAMTTASGFLPPSDDVTIKWTESQAAPEQLVRLNTETWQLVRLEEGVLRSRVVLDYEVIRGKLSMLAVQIPKDVVVYKVIGAGVEDWRTFAAKGEKPRQVQISLTGTGSGKRRLEMQLERVAPRTAGASIEVPVVRPLGAFREMGAVALFDGKKIGFAPLKEAPGFMPAGQDALPTHVRKTLKDKVSQAFKHVGAPGQLSTKVAAAQAKDVRFDARMTTLYDVGERSLRATAAVLVELKSGRVDHLVISLPDGVNEPKVTAPSLNKVLPAKAFKAGKGRRAWEVTFTQALEGALQLQIEFDMVLPKELGAIRLPDVRVHGAEVEEGTIALTAEASIELKADPSKDLRPVPVAELPRALRRQSERELLYGFRYSHAPWALQVAVQRHRTVQTLDAMVTRAWLETSVLDSGHLSTRALYEVRNSDRQFVRVALPKDAKVLSVQAGGKRIKPVQDESGALAIPLPKGKTLMLELRYELKVEALGLFGSVSLVAPKVDVRQGELRWTLRTPASHGLFGISTNLKDASGTGWAPPPKVSDDSALTVPMPMPENPVARRFTYSVHEPDEPALSVAFGHSSVPESAVDGLLFWLALLCLVVATWRRLSSGAFNRTTAVLVVVAAVALALKGAVWGVAFGELVTVALACGVVAAGFGLRRVIGLARGDGGHHGAGHDDGPADSPTDADSERESDSEVS